MSDKKYCFKCGTEEPEYKVVGYLRKCNECGEKAVVTVSEMMDIMNNLTLKGLIPEEELQDYVDEEFQREELQFDDDYSAVLRAEVDAMKDFLEDYNE